MDPKHSVIKGLPCILNGGEVQIVNSVTMINVWHHEACQVMPKSYPEKPNFQFASNNHFGFFFLRTLSLRIAFKLKFALFCKFYAKISTFEPPHDKTSKMACAPSEDSDQPGHPPSLTRVFAVRLKKA